MNLDALVAPLRADVVSGAAVVGRTAAEVVRRAAVRIPADDPAALRRELGGLAVKMVEAQPAMAPLVALAREVLEAVEGADPDGGVPEARRAAARAAEGFREALESRALAVARRAAALLPDGCTVLTVSSSSTVRAALLEAAGRGIRVVCLEGRPAFEGRALATALGRAGVPVVLAVDAAGWCLAEGADVILLGADSVGDAGVVNKIGTASLAAAAGARGLPVHVAADRTKLLPAGFPQPLDDDRPADEVWRGATGVRVWNRYFEALPLARVTGVVTEDGVLDPAATEAVRRTLTLPAELATWARARGGGGPAEETERSPGGRGGR